MKDYQQRVIDEQSDLFTKLVKLEWFLNSPKIADIPKDEKDLLSSQLTHMSQYNNLLLSRISLFS